MSKLKILKEEIQELCSSVGIQGIRYVSQSGPNVIKLFASLISECL